MRAIPPALQAKLDGGVTTLCRCWLITRNDGVTQGFTDHDADIALGSVVCRAGTGLSGSEATQKLGLAVDSSELAGALTDDSLNEADLAAGRYDAAAVELWLVDWSDPSLCVLLAKGAIGEVRREGAAFTAEVRGISDRLNQDSGRLFTATCSADVGDARCKVNLTGSSAYLGHGTVLVMAGTSSFVATGLDDYDDGWFTAGKLTFDGGANAGISVEVKLHRKFGGGAFYLWQVMPEPIAVGDTFIVTAGCDKRFATCRARFDNTDNFRGFPHIPGTDFVVRHATPGAGNNGLSLQS